MNKTVIKIITIIILCIISIGSILSQTVYTVTKTTDPDPFVYRYHFDDNICATELIGTLQWAIRKVNDTQGNCIINFNIPGTGPHTILIDHYIPQINNSSVIIDGRTQTGYSFHNPAVIIDKQEIDSDGFVVFNSNLEIHGLHIRNFMNSSILLWECDSSKITTNILNMRNYQDRGNFRVLLYRCNNAEIYGNIIGNEVTEPIINSTGIYLWESNNCNIGGTQPQQPNIFKRNVIGMIISTSNFVKISHNLMLNNNWGILLYENVNQNKQAPEIINLSNNILTGTSFPGDSIEVFGSTGFQSADEYLTTVFTDATGDWSATISGINWPYVIATATDAANNTSMFSNAFEISIPCTAYAGEDTAICYGEITQLNASAGVSYLWTSTPYDNSLSGQETQQNPIVTPSTTTTYTFTVSDALGCTASDDVVVTAYPLPIADAGSDVTIFAGDSVQIGTAPINGYTYAWSPATGLSSTTVANPWAKPTQNTTFYLTVTDDNICLAYDSIEIAAINPSEGEFLPHSVLPNDSTPLVFDRFGNTYYIEDITRGSCIQGWQTGAPDATAGFFRLSYCYEPQATINPFTPAIIDVINKVFSDLSQLIVQQNCGTIQSLVYIQINAPQGMPIHVLGGASQFYIPQFEIFTNLSNENTGILYGEVWRAVNSGVNDPALLDARIDINFYTLAWPYNTNILPNQTQLNQIDLYSVLLHEVIHTLGFASLIRADGLSWTSPIANFYSKYDTYLSSNNIKLIDWDNLYSVQFNPILNPVTDLQKNCPDVIRFNGISSNMLPIANFNQGAISHFGCLPPNTPQIMKPGILVGHEFRTPTNDDINILCDLGYQISGIFDNVQISQQCGHGVIGINDGFYQNNLSCSQNIILELCNIGDAITINFSDLLANDINANAITGLQMLGNNGAFTSTASSFTYIPAYPGLVFFRYIPINTNTGEIGNTTAIVIEVFPCNTLTGCFLPDLCNMICNPDIAHPNGAICGTTQCNGGGFGCELTTNPPPNWMYAHGTPDFQICPTSNPPNPNYLRLGASYATWYLFSEGVLTNVNIIQGHNYTFSYFRRRGDLNINDPLQHLFIRLINQNTSPNIPGPFNDHTFPGVPNDNQLISHEINIIDQNWIQVTVCFTADANYNLLWIYPLMTQSGNFDINASIYIDRIVLVEDTYYAGSDQQITCGNATLGIGACEADNASYSWINTNTNTQVGTSQQISVNVNLSTTFEVNRSYPSNPSTVIFPIQSNNCLLTDQVNVTVLEPIIINTSSTNSCSTSCNGTTSVISVLNGVAPFHYLWDANTGNQATQTATGLCIGTYTVTVTDANGCTASDDVVVNVTPDNTVTLITANNIQIVCINQPIDDIIYATTGANGVSITGLPAGVSFNMQNNIITISGTPTVTGTFNYTVLLLGGCGNVTTSGTITVIDNVNCCLPATITIPDGATSSNIGAIPIGSVVDVQGLFIINNNLSLQNCTLRMYPNAKIDVLAGCSLNLRICTVFSCDEMWDGIYSNPGAYVRLLRCRIEDATYAVFSSNGGTYNIELCTFNKNNISLFVDIFAGIHPGVVIKSTFDCTVQGSQTPDAVLKAPMAGQISHFGIYCKNNHNITFGQASAQSNVFRNLEIGIFALSSNVFIYRNNFQDIIQPLCIQPFPPTTPCPTIGWPIWAQNSDLTVGSTFGSTHENNFSNCSNGILIEGKSSFHITKNNFTNIVSTGPMGFLIQSKCIFVNNVVGVYTGVISDNNFNNFENGIYYRFNRMEFLTIVRNIMSDFNGTAIYLIQNQQHSHLIDIKNNLINRLPNQAGAYGIRVQNAVQQGFGLNVNIEQNTIKNVRHGIWLSNYYGTNIKDQSPAFNSTDNNNPSGIYYPNSLPASFSVGIKVENSPSTNIRNNLIQKAMPNPTTAYTNKLYGISVEASSIDSRIKENIVRRLGKGLNFYGQPNAPLIASCNRIYQNRTGVSLNNTFIGDQGNTYEAQDNQWGIPGDFTNNWLGAERIASPSTMWYSRSATLPFFPNQTNQMFPAYAILLGNAAGAPYNCSFGCPNPPCLNIPNIRKMAKKENPYNGLSQEEIFMLDIKVYELLKQEPAYTNTGNIQEDSLLIAYRDSLANTNIGRFYEFAEKLEAGDTLGAYNSLMSVTPVYSPETNQKIVYEIYWKTWSRNIFEFEPNDSLLLYQVAEQRPHLGGTAVYDARVMLGLDFNDFEDVQQRMAQDDSANEEISILNNEGELKIILYPNPTGNFIMYLADISDKENATLYINNMLGETLHTIKINTHEGRIDLHRFASGMYLYKVYINNTQVKAGTFIINK